MADNFSNDARTTLTGSMAVADTSMVIADGSLFPAPPFRARVESELLRVTATAGNTWTIERGIEGTAAASHPAGAAVAHVLTAGALTDMVAAIGAGEGPKVLASRAATMALAHDVYTAIPWDAPTLDTGPFWDAAQPTRFTIPEAGLYLVWARWRMSPASATGGRSGTLRKNGSVWIIQQDIVPHAAVWPDIVWGQVVQLAAADFLQFLAYQSSGAAGDVQAGPFSPFAGLLKVGNV